AARPDGRAFATGSDEGLISEWDLQSQPLGRPIESSGRISTMQYSADCRLLYVAESSGTVSIHDRMTGHLCGAKMHLPGAAYALAVSQDGRRVACSDAESDVKVWQCREPAPMRPAPVTQANSKAVGYSRDGALAFIEEQQADNRRGYVIDTGTGDLIAGPWPMRHWTYSTYFTP